MKIPLIPWCALALAPLASAAECDNWSPGGVVTLAAGAQRLAHCNADIAIARRAVDAASGDLKSASHAPNPTLGLAVSNINPAAGTGNGALWHRTVDSGIRFDQSIERGGKRAARSEVAENNVLVARAMLTDTVMRQEQAYLEAYVTVVAQQRSVTLLEQAATAYRDGMEAMQRRLKAGDIPVIEVSRAALDAGRAEAEVQGARQALTEARAALALLLGTSALPPDTALASIEALSAAVPASAAPLTAGGVDARADVRAAGAAFDAAEAGVRLARSGRVRDLDFSVGFDHWPTSAANLQGTGDSYTIGVTVPLFLYDSGRGPLQHALADRDSARLHLMQVLDRAHGEAQAATEALERARDLERRYNEALLPAAQSILTALELAYRRGGVSLLDLLDARRNARQVEQEALSSQRELLVALGRQRLAQGLSPFAPFGLPDIESAS